MSDGHRSVGQAPPQKGSIVFVFLDGLGLAPASAGNPLSEVPMPCLRALLGGPLVRDGTGSLVRPHTCVGEPDLLLAALDACLGVEGMPQSATGQTALFTGVNAAARVGTHVTAYPTAPLRQVIAEHSLLKRAAGAGREVLFANAHSERFWQMVRTGERSLSASTLTALAADRPIPTLADLEAGRAVLWDITHELATRHLGYSLPVIGADEAGARLARLALDYDLVLYESFLPDLAGHRRLEAEWVLSRLDAFFGGLLAQRSAGTTVVVSSDHGNLEDSSTKLHTLNPVPLLAAGPAAGHFAGCRSIADVAPAILEAIGV